MKSFDPSPRDPYGALRQANFRYFLCGNTLSTIGMQMLAVAIMWELYETTHSATALGLVGLCQALPIFLLAIPAGHLADRFNRKTIILIDQLLLAFSAATLGFTSLFQDRIPDWPILHSANTLLAAVARLLGETHCDFTAKHVPIMFALLLVFGVIRSINQPAKQALLPQLVPSAAFPNAVMWNASIYESSTIAGPMFAGYALAVLQSHETSRVWSYAAIYFITAGCQLAQWLFFLPIAPAVVARSREPVTLRSLNAGIYFVLRAKVILASMTLDLFGVLLGGATALLPIYAKDILHCGVDGLGWLQAAPAIGACLIGVLVAHLPPIKQTGRVLLLAVTGFGVATIAFGLSKNFYLSLTFLILVGACNNISVIIRQTLIQMLTPDSLRGRVTAVKTIFSSSANGLGWWESGWTAAPFGPVVSVVAGGIGTILVVATVATLWPQLRKFGALHDCKPLDLPADDASIGKVA